MPKNGVTQYQIKELTADVQSLKSDVKLVLENHLPHLKEDMLRLDTRIGELSGKMTVFTGVNVGAVILGVIITKLLR